MALYNMTTETKSSAIANELEERILSKTYRMGEPLPSQNVLANEFNASSRSVREAFKILEAKGLIQVQQGKRATVKSNSLDQFVESLSMSMLTKQSMNKKMITDLMEIRTTMEVSAVRKLSRETSRTLVVRTLDKLCTKMERIVEAIPETKNSEVLANFKAVEFEFHTFLIKSTDNIILNSIFETLSPQLFSAIDSLPLKIAEIRKSVTEYRYLVESLENGQTDLAVALALVNLTKFSAKIEDIDEEEE